MGDIIYLKNLKFISGGYVAIPKDMLYYIKNYFELSIVKNILSQDNLSFIDFDILLKEWDFYMANSDLYSVKTLSGRITLALFLINAGVRVDLYYPLVMIESKVPEFIKVYGQMEFREED